MSLTMLQKAGLVAALTLGVLLWRFLPPLLFPNGKKHPQLIDDLTPLIPPAIIGLLAVYSLKDVSLLTGNHGLPELISAAAVAAVHYWRRNTLLSIFVGTACYMLLCRVL